MRSAVVRWPLPCSGREEVLPRHVRRSEVSVHSSKVAMTLAIVATALTAWVRAENTNNYRVTILVSNEADEAPVVDPKLVNAWGIAANATSPWWVANNGTDSSTLYNGNG